MQIDITTVVSKQSINDVLALLFIGILSFCEAQTDEEIKTVDG